MKNKDLYKAFCHCNPWFDRGIEEFERFYGTPMQKIYLETRMQKRMWNEMNKAAESLESMTKVIEKTATAIEKMFGSMEEIING